MNIASVGAILPTGSSLNTKSHLLHAQLMGRKMMGGAGARAPNVLDHEAEEVRKRSEG